MSFAELQSKIPSVKCKLQVIERPQDAKLWLGGSDFKLNPLIKCISVSRINNDMWAYADSNVLYINCSKLKTEKELGYAKVVNYGRYLGFYKSEAKQGIRDAAAFGGLIGASIAIATSQQPLQRTLYVIDMNEGKLFWVDSAFIVQRLSAFPAVVQEFNKEIHKDDVEVQRKYIDILNAKM